MRKLLVVLALVLLPLAPVRAQFCPGVAPWVFVDVAASHAFCTYVTWMAQNNVTLGCRIIDASTREYCPADGVTRLQMAAFMNRLGDALFPSTCAAGQVMKWNGAAWTCAADSIGGGGGGGTVTSVLAGTGLSASPNPIIGAGVMNLALGYQLPQACANGQVPKSNGAGGWTCAADNDTNSGGTVTSVAAGTGLVASPNPVVGTGSINLAPGYQLPQGCANGQVAKSNGTGGWTCAADNNSNSGGTVTSLTQGSGIVLAPSPIVAAGTISADTAYLQRRVSASCAAGSSIRAIAADGTVICETDDAGPANTFVAGGNAFGGEAVLGTTDNNALDVRVNTARVMRFEPNAISPNLVGGHSGNSANAGVRGATIGGGGAAVGSEPDFVGEAPNRVTDHYGTVGGGLANRAGDDAGATTDRRFATVGGGFFNEASGQLSTVGGGFVNTASGRDSTVGGGNNNTASGSSSTVGGGSFNSAAGDYSVAMGSSNTASGDHSIAMGRRAKAYNGANIGHGTIVIADGNDFDFNIGTDNRFAVRATGGIYFALGIDGTGAATWICQASNGNAWACASDRNLKHSLVELDARDVLDKVAALPVYQWQPKGQNAHVLHYGPMAQDFHAAFGLGDDDKMIGMQDADGVALAAIKGLNEKLETTIAAQAREIAELRRLVEQLIDRR